MKGGMRSTLVSLQVEHPFVGVLGEQSVEYGAGRIPVFAEYIPFLDIFRALSPG